MKQKIKKRLVNGAIIAIWLLGCYFIGQATHPRENTNTAVTSTEIVADQNIDEKKSAYDTPENEKQDSTTEDVTVNFFNARQLSTDDIPWGVTAGTITLDDGSEAWLLTPGTSLSCESASGIVLECRIHPWMSNTSDGARMVISSETDSETIDIGLASREISAGPGMTRFELLNTDKNDGDWVIIQQKVNETVKESERDI